MPVKTSKHCRLYPEESDGTRILAMRYWPRGCEKNQFDVWMKHLAPSEGLLRWCRSQDKSDKPLDPQIFLKTWRDRYLGEMEEQREAIADLQARHKSGETITLLCACHDLEKCHRTILADLILASEKHPGNEWMRHQNRGLMKAFLPELQKTLSRLW